MKTRLIIALLAAALLLPTGTAQAAKPPTTSLEVATIETTVSTETLSDDAHGQTRLLAATSCWGATRTQTARNFFGSALWSYSQRIEWCGNGTYIVGSPYRTRWANVYVAGWQFRGHIGNSSINRGTSYSAFTQGSFSICAPFVSGACVYRYPYINQTVLPNGFTYGNQGG